MRIRMLLSTSWLVAVCRERVAVMATQVLPLKRIALELVSVAGARFGCEHTMRAAALSRGKLSLSSTGSLTFAPRSRVTVKRSSP